MEKKKNYTLSEVAAGCGVSRQRVHLVLTEKRLLADCQSYGERNYGKQGKHAAMILIPFSVVEKLPWKFAGKK